jgi:hypothetical protein
LTFLTGDAMKSHLKLILTIFLLGWMVSSAPFAGSRRVSALAVCDAAQFIADVTVPDGTIFAPGTAFTKTWRLKNIGTCTWTTAYSLVFVSGEPMGGPASVTLPTSVSPGQTVDVSVALIAPTSAGTFRGYWQLKNASGGLFGIGSTFVKPFWIEITVQTPQQSVTGFDFAAEMCNAQWTYDGGPIPCPLNVNKKDFGFVQRVDNPTLENGVSPGLASLLTVPQNKYNGVIRGAFDVTDIFPGDHFQALIGCEFGAVNCYVTYELDYQTPQNEFITIWKFREKYDGLTYQANVDLTPVANKKNIKLVLMISASGPASGDRPLWVAPRIVRSTSGPVVSPNPTPISTVPVSISGCDRAQFIADVSVPDSTAFAPNASFTKTWRLKNVGSCTWTTAYSLVFVSGEKMGGPDAVLLPQTVVPGQTVDIGVNLAAPSIAGSYRGYWELKNSSGKLFGIGTNADKPFWVDIRVTDTSGASTAYDFAGNVCAAQWTSGAGSLPCPGTDGDARGFVLSVANPMLENGTTDTRPGLLTFPQNVFDGYIQGLYPSFHVQSGDRFQALVNCQYGATDCFVLFRLDYQIGSGPIQSLWSIGERYDGLYYPADIDLSSLAGQDVRFALTVLANGSATGDRALWVAPRIVRVGLAIGGGAGSSTSTDTPTPIPTP